jgi:Rrf2 family protein
MLKLTKKTEYALIAMTHLARQPGAQVSARDMAHDYNIPADLLAKVMQQLQGAGLIASHQGSHGGYTLACAPGQVKLSELITLMEGPLAFIDCMKSGENPREDDCDQYKNCTIIGPLQLINRKIKDVLDSYTLQDLIHPKSPKHLESIHVKSHNAHLS